MLSACPRETYPVGQRGSGWGQRLEVSNWWRFPAGSEVGSRQTLVSWVPFLAAAEAVEASASRPLRCGLPGVGSTWRRRPAICRGLVDAQALGPQNRMARGSRASRNSRGPGEGLPDKLAEAQWSWLAPMQAA